MICDTCPDKPKACKYCLITTENPMDVSDLSESNRAAINRMLVAEGIGNSYYNQLDRCIMRCRIGQPLPSFIPTTELNYLNPSNISSHPQRSLNWLTGELMPIS